MEGQENRYDPPTFGSISACCGHHFTKRAGSVSHWKSLAGESSSNCAAISTADLALNTPDHGDYTHSLSGDLTDGGRRIPAASRPIVLRGAVEGKERAVLKMVDLAGSRSAGKPP